MIFWISWLVLSVFVAAGVFWPLWSQRADRFLGDGLETDDTAKPWEDEKDRLVGQIRALDVSLAEEKISAEEHAEERGNLVADAERALSQLQKARKAHIPAEPSYTPRKHRLHGTLLAIFFFLISGGITVFLAEDGLGRNSLQHPIDKTSTPAAQGAPDVNAMVARLEARLTDGKGSSEDLALLARSYRMMGKKEDALALYHRVLEKDPNNIDALMSLGTAHFVSKETDSNNLKKAESYFDQALTVNPELPEALWLKSKVLLKRNNTQEARPLLEHLEQLVASDHDALRTVRKLLNKINNAEEVRPQ